MRRPKLFIVGFLLLAAAGLRAQARRPPLPAQAITAMAAGRPLRDVVLVQVENSPCLSLRDVQRLTGGSVAWKRVAREASLIHENRALRLTLDASVAVLDGRDIPLDVPVRWWTGQAYVPLTLLLTPDFQSFAGAAVSWDPGRKILAATPTPDISSPRFSAQADRVRVTFDLGARVDYRVLRRTEDSLLIRFFGGRAGPRERLEVQNTLMPSVDILPRARSTDVLFVLGEAAGAPVVTLEDAPRRLAVEVRGRGAAEPEEAPASEVDAAPPIAPAPVLLPVPRERPSAKSGGGDAALAALSPVRVIVVDPGHGGKDAGAVGRRGTLEKDINLIIAKSLAKALEAGGRYEVRLTRSDDEFVSLQDRAEFANKAGADLFISIHCNAALSSRSTGFEIYFLSERATDDAAAAVARRENAAIELEGPADKVQAKVAQLLWSLAKTEDLNESSELAALVHDHARKDLEVDARGVKQAGFYVLKWARMPAVLVESAFITNPKEEGLLRSDRYVEKVVRAVVSGVRDYERRKTQALLGRRPVNSGS